MSADVALAHMAELLGVEGNDLRAAIGNDWTMDGQRFWSDSTTVTYSGRHDSGTGAGPLVVIRLDPNDRLVEIGPAEGTWQDPAQLQWAPGEPHSVLAWDDLSREPEHAAGMLHAMHECVVEAMVLKQAGLQRCRECDEHFIPEFMFSVELCYGCASTTLGVVY